MSIITDRAPLVTIVLDGSDPDEGCEMIPPPGSASAAAALVAKVVACDEIDDADPAGESWETWSDAHDCSWTLGPDPSLVPDEGLTLDGLIAMEIARFRRMDTEAGDLMAEALAELAADAAVTGAETPAQLRDRRDALQLSQAERMARGAWPFDFPEWVPPGVIA